MKKNVNAFCMASLLLMATACKKESSSQQAENQITSNKSNSETSAESVIFKSYFNQSTVVSQTSAGADISGTNDGMDWSTTAFGSKFSIQYEGGSLTDREASIDNTSGNVLKYRITNPNVTLYNSNGTVKQKKARIQANIYNFNNPVTGQSFKEIYQTVRMKLDATSFQKILNNPNVMTSGKPDWLTLMEFWNDPNWIGSAYPFRVTLGLKKSGSVFKFHVSGEKDTSTGWLNQWTSDHTSTSSVVLGQWMTVETYFKEGNSSTGRFWMAVQVDGQARTKIFDFNEKTYDTSNPSPNGITYWNPMKLYCSDNVIYGVQPSPLQVFWDGYFLYHGKLPNL